VAVAYCGEGVHRFFPEKPSAWPEDLRIIVDASEETVKRGLTNPKGIEHLLGLTDAVRSLHGLHAKVFVFDEDVVLVGSANMSESSITNQYQSTLEVSDPRIAKQMVTWFDNTLWSNAKRVDPAMVGRLMPLWPGREGHSLVLRRRERCGVGAAMPLSHPSLLLISQSG
jgi:phosphatidylserine/phosphatidylglycerophosphate/cardiolipin synthase-like enzyme